MGAVGTAALAKGLLDALLPTEGCVQLWDAADALEGALAKALAKMDGAAATMRTGSSPVSKSSTRSAPFSATQSAPANPTSREPSSSMLTMFCGFSNLVSKPATERRGR